MEKDGKYKVKGLRKKEKRKGMSKKGLTGTAIKERFEGDNSYMDVEME